MNMNYDPHSEYYTQAPPLSMSTTTNSAIYSNLENFDAMNPSQQQAGYHTIANNFPKDPNFYG
jgi:hypothetical protein